MFKKFSFWVVLALIASMGCVVLIHWITLQEVHQKTAVFQVLSERQRVLDSLSLSLEKYRRLSGSFRKLNTEELDGIKNQLRLDFKKGSEALDRLDPVLEDSQKQRVVREQLNELLNASARIEPMLFSKDAYIREEVQQLHDQLVSTLLSLKQKTEARVSALSLEAPSLDSQSVRLLCGVGVVVLALVLSLFVKTYFTYRRPLRRLHQYADELKRTSGLPKDRSLFVGVFGEIQSTLDRLTQHLETHTQNRHQFMQDLVSDLRAPLRLLQEGKYLLSDETSPLDPLRKLDAEEAVRMGLALISGSLDDLDDLVAINQLETRLDEKIIDLSETISDSTRKLLGARASEKIKVSVPPMPIWMRLDPARLERMMIQVLSRILDTLSEGRDLTLTVSQTSSRVNQSGVEILIQDSERLKGSRPIPTGPEQELMKHWLGEKGLSMALASKIVKAHGGTITVAGILGSSLTVWIRLPKDRVVETGLITAPGLKTQKMNQPLGDLGKARATL